MIEFRTYSKGFLENVTIEELPLDAKADDRKGGRINRSRKH
jgi:hypothetical protein